VYQPRELVASPIVFILDHAGQRAGGRHGRERRADLAWRQRRDRNDLELRRCIAKQTVRACRVPGGQHEAVAAGRQRSEQIAKHRPQSGKAFERSQLEEFVEQERSRQVAGRPDGIEKRQRSIERAACARVAAIALPERAGREWRVVAQRFEKSFWRRRDALDVHVLSRRAADQIAQTQQ
jgi:hypothetical protein